MANTKFGRISFVFLADGHKTTAGGKLDAFGLFNKFLVWGTPAIRECSIIFSAEGLSAGRSDFQIFTRSPGRKITVVGGISIEPEDPRPSTTSAVRVSIPFRRSGPHSVGIGPKGGGPRSIRWVSVSVDAMPWATLPTGERLQQLLSEPNTLKVMRATLTCKKCGKSYTFELALDPAHKYQRGVREFPADGRFRCPNCDTVHHTRDIEGQFRFHLSEQQTGGAK